MSMKTLLILGLLVGLTSPAVAQYVEEPDAPTTPEAKATRLAELITKTGEALNAGNHQLALQRIEAAIKLSDDPSLIANKAFILEKLGQYKDAVGAFQRYLELAPAESPKVAHARKLLKRLMPQITFNSTPAGATVVQQGVETPLGTTPFRKDVVAGTSLFIISAEGYKPLRHLVNVVPDKPLTVDVELERKAPPKAANPLPKAVVERPKDLSDDDEGGTTYAWISLGTAAVAAGAAGLFYGAGVEAADARDASTRAADWDAHHSTLEGKNILYLSSGGLALVAGVVGTYLLLTAPSDTPETLSATPGTGVFSVEF